MRAMLDQLMGTGRDGEPLRGSGVSDQCVLMLALAGELTDVSDSEACSANHAS